MHKIVNKVEMETYQKAKSVDNSNIRLTQDLKGKTDKIFVRSRSEPLKEFEKTNSKHIIHYPMDGHKHGGFGSEKYPHAHFGY